VKSSIKNGKATCLQEDLMQFGKFQGAVLIGLGMALILLQVFLYHPLKTTAPPSGENPTAPLRGNNTSSVAGILGGICLLAGGVIYFTARRRDEPHPKDAVK
jgi:hypothetical protein